MNIKYPINEHYFDNINSPEKAYFLGILYADGNNCLSPYNMIRISLEEKDKPVLEKLADLIFLCKRPLILVKGGVHKFKFKNKEYISKDGYSLSICNKHISKTLNKKGLVPAKSLILTFPTWLNKKLESHFIRGYFDGDGSVSFTAAKQISISILGTQNFCNALYNISQKYKISCSVCNAKKGLSLQQFVVHGNQSGRKFLDFIYKDSTIHLDRKFNKYKEIIEIIPPARIIYDPICKLCDASSKRKGYCTKHHYQLFNKEKRHIRYLTIRK